ncbi:MAG: hypothetical protein JST04_12745 [Bdellovibrionales bacterium]|nr:hypothetical protein [Bdellovibrionales bacterium]
MTILRYPSGQPISTNVIQALRFVGKVGFLSRESWHEFFGIGSRRWQEQQLQYAVEKRLFRKHRNPVARRFFVVGEEGAEFLKGLKAACVSPVPVMYLTHDHIVAQSMMRLNRAGLVRSFHVERELKTYGMKDFKLGEQDRDPKYPDAVFRINAFGGMRTVAVEYERERKSSSRYRNIVFQYAGLTHLSMILYIVENDGIRSAVESALKHLGTTALHDKMAFVSAEDWQKSPLTAAIKLKSGDVKLGEICTPFAA